MEMNKMTPFPCKNFFQKEHLIFNEIKVKYQLYPYFGGGGANKMSTIY